MSKIILKALEIVILFSISFTIFVFSLAIFASYQLPSTSFEIPIIFWYLGIGQIVSAITYILDKNYEDRFDRVRRATNFGLSWIFVVLLVFWYLFDEIRYKVYREIKHKLRTRNESRDR